MKANAPEKIYLEREKETDKIHHLWGRTPVISSFYEHIEYTHTDAFIEKACEWIETNMDDYIYVEYDTVTGMPTNEAHIAHKKVVEDFKNYMKNEE